jgi:hypothetical protein
MTTRTQPEATASVFPDPFAQAQTRALETVSALAEANQRVLGKLVELSAVAARETFRTWAELQSATLDAVRSAPAPAMLSPGALEDLRRDPLAWYGQGLAEATSATQRVARLAETNAQIFARGAERFEAFAEQAGKEIRDAITSCVDRAREIHGGK